MYNPGIYERTQKDQCTQWVYQTWLKLNIDSKLWNPSDQMVKNIGFPVNFPLNQFIDWPRSHYHCIMLRFGACAAAAANEFPEARDRIDFRDGWGHRAPVQIFSELDGYGSIPIHTIFRGMNIHLPAILMFTRGIGFWPIPRWVQNSDKGLDLNMLVLFWDQAWLDKNWELGALKIWYDYYRCYWSNLFNITRISASQCLLIWSPNGCRARCELWHMTRAGPISVLWKGECCGRGQVPRWG